ncbi:MAG: dihydroorotase [Acidimicrobiales bacterium]|jgi:dihydroorotase
MPEVLIRGGTIVDEQGERRGDVLVSGADIVAVAATIEPPAGARVLEAGGCIVSPGLVDLHTHLREPGAEVAETVETGCRAAALGGYTAVVAMPNTVPAIDNASIARDVLELGRDAMAQVAVAAAITVGRRGTQLAPMGELAALGIHLFTDDGTGVQDASLMRQALEYASDLGVVLAQHCQDDSLSAGGQMHEGAWSSRLGIVGQPALAEESMLARDLALVRATRSPMHFLHLSTAGSVELVRRAKAEGLPVTAEATPHHLSLTDAEVASYDSVFKVNPPLREAADVEAVSAGLEQGVIDAVATDHAPHTPDKKEMPFDEAPPGMLGLETALAVVSGAMGERLGLVDLFAAFSWRPARIARLDPASGGRQGGPVEPGSAANLVVFDPAAEWSVDPGRLASRSRNTPYAGRRLTGKVRHTLLEGEPVVVDGEAQR